MVRRDPVGLARLRERTEPIGSGNGAELATYVVEKGKPLITLLK